jgi:hypothetical protein
MGDSDDADAALNDARRGRGVADDRRGAADQG